MHKKMSRIDRAKQFAPFDALKGLHEALIEQEIKHENAINNKIKLAKEIDAEDANI